MTYSEENNICEVPFCSNFKNGNKSSVCGAHRYEREKYGTKPYKELLPFWAYRRCPIHGLLNIKQVIFHKTGQKRCKKCVNSQYDLEKSKKYYGKYIERYREGRLQKRYKISMDEYQELLKKQNHVCLICKIHIDEIKARKGKNHNLAVDHCHKTNKIRGLLCNKCNMGLGYFNDDAELIQSAYQYLLQ